MHGNQSMLLRNCCLSHSDSPVSDHDHCSHSSIHQSHSHCHPGLTVSHHLLLAVSMPSWQDHFSVQRWQLSDLAVSFFCCVGIFVGQYCRASGHAHGVVVCPFGIWRAGCGSILSFVQRVQDHLDWRHVQLACLTQPYSQTVSH